MSASAAHAEPTANDPHGHHDHHVVVDWPDDPQYGTASASKIGMWIFLLSDAFSFAGLLITYGVLRSGSEKWGAAAGHGEPELGINFTAGLTFLLICSSVTMVLAHAAAVEKKRRSMVLFLALTALGGLLFLGGQAIEYTELSHEGLHFGHSAYASTFYLITSFHGFHVLTGTIYLLVTLVRAMRGSFDNNPGPVEVCGLFWHFVDLVWILVFTFIYLIPA